MHIFNLDWVPRTALAALPIEPLPLNVDYAKCFCHSRSCRALMTPAIEFNLKITCIHFKHYASVLCILILL